MKKCKSCQTEIDNKAKKCPHCQTDQRNWFAKHKILTVILALVLIGMVSSSGSKNAGTTTNTSGSPKNEAKKDQPIVKIGEAVQANDLSFTVTDTTKAKSLGNSYTKKDAQGTFNIITLNIKNTGKETVTIDSSMMKITDSQGRTFDRSIEGQTAKGLSQGKVDLFLQQVQPGLAVTGEIVFDLPDDAAGLTLLVRGSIFGSEKQISLTE
jgi:hypothetical protein